MKATKVIYATSRGGDLWRNEVELREKVREK